MSSSTASPSIWWNWGVWWRLSPAGTRARGSPRTAAADAPPSRAPASARCACAAPAPSADVERVGARPRGMRRAVVERVEVVVHGLDLRPLHDGEAEPEEDVFELAPGLRQHVQAPDRLRRRARQRHVDAVGAQALLELAAPSSSPARASISASSAWRAWLAALPTAPRSCRRQLGDPAQQLRQLGLAPEVAHAQLLERVAGGGGGRSAPRASALSSLDPLDHDAGTLDGRRVISYSATVAAIAAFSDSDAIGMRATRSQAATSSPGRPSRSAPTSSVDARLACAGGPLQRLARAGDQRDPLARQLADVATRASATRRSRPCWRARPSAQWGSAQPGPSATTRRRTRRAERMTVPTLPGIPDAVQVDAQRPAAAPQRCS